MILLPVLCVLWLSLKPFSVLVVIMLDVMEETQGTKEASSIAGALDVGQWRMSIELQEGNELGKEAGTANRAEAVPSSPRAPCGISSSATFC